MKSLDNILKKAAARPYALDIEEREELLSLEREDELAKLFDAAYNVKVRCCGRKVAMRGIIEAGNICMKDCGYCGIRRSNTKVVRYALDAGEIVRMAEFAAKAGYASVVIQSGEIESDAHTSFIEDVLRGIRHLDLGVTLSLGEQSERTYRRWKDSGASRYLLRIETSNRKLYGQIHPATHSWERRVECLRALRRCGYQVGTGVMCGLPGQTMRDLAGDIGFFAEIDADMIGMGPFIPHPDTPLGDAPFSAGERFALGLKMIAVTRLHIHDINIAAATALQALASDGRERGVRAGANVVMPNITDTKYRRSYQLYAHKPCLDENALLCRGCVERRLASIGESVAYGQRGDSRHYLRRVGNKRANLMRGKF